MNVIIYGCDFVDGSSYLTSILLKWGHHAKYTFFLASYHFIMLFRHLKTYLECF